MDAGDEDVTLFGSEEAIEFTGACEVGEEFWEAEVDCSFCLNKLACIFHSPLSSDLSLFESEDAEVCLELLVEASFLSRSLILLVIDIEVGLEGGGPGREEF